MTICSSFCASLSYAHVNQTFLMDDTKTVKAYVDDASKELNSKLEVTAFRRWKCGEAAPKCQECGE